MDKQAQQQRHEKDSSPQWADAASGAQKLYLWFLIDM